MTSPSLLPDEPFDEELFRKQKELIVAPKRPLDPAFHSPKHFIKTISSSVKEKGLRAVHEGRVACLINAGGQGSRLGIKGPKGLAKVLGEKTLFHLLCEKAESACQIAIMTSLENHRETREFFLENQFFGLNPDQIHFFMQNQFPLMDETGNWFSTPDGKTAVAPNGNGEALQLLHKNGIYAKWQELGIEHVNILPIDNPLAHPFDIELIGLQIEKKVPLTVKAVERRNAKEPMGLFAEKEGRLHVLEYSEYSEKKLDQWKLGNTALFCVSMPFIEKVRNSALPLHVAKKTLNGKKVYKFEKFNFDLFSHADSYAGIIANRKKCFSPLKNATGEDSFDTVKNDLLR